MSHHFHQRLLCLMGCVMATLALSLQSKPLDLDYDQKSKELSVDASGQTLLEVLGQLATRTGWHIFVEPDSNPEVHTRFKEVGVGRAIELLVGRMNYALVPQAEGPTKLFVFRTSRDQATLQVPAAEEEPPTATIRRVGNELIVTVEPGTDIEALAKRLGAEVVGQLSGTDTYRLRFADEDTADTAREQLAGEPGIKEVEYNYVVEKPTPPQSIGQGSGPLPPVQLALKPPPADGKVVIGLVDTAVQSLGGDLDGFVLAGKSVAGEVTPSDTTPTHGTSMADAILRSIQKSSPDGSGIRILPVDIYGANETTTSFDMAAGIITAVNEGANVINISSGSYGSSSFLDNTIREALKNDIAVIGAGGNVPVENPVYPAAIEGVYGIAAYENNARAPYSTTGDFVSIAGPGTVPGTFNGRSYLIRGTSPAAAWISGQTGALAESDGLSPAEAAEALAKRFPANP